MIGLPGNPDLAKRWAICLIACMACALPRCGWCQDEPNIDNPVLPGVADAGVFKYNGEYYIGGVFTDGSFYKSKDLVNWDGPVHVFSMDNDWTEGPSADDSQIHANDINYVNGIFHQYWSVNYWGSDQHVVHIGHAISSDVLGPYKEPVRETWLDNRIDPELFIDDDGTPYLYMVKFTDGNTIWGRRMADPWTFSDAPTYLFASLPGTWETQDNRVAEGPSVIKYRNRYYMLYNANHTSTRWGNYAIGVAEADAPLSFNHGSKYPHPVVNSNQVGLEERFPDILRFNADKDQNFSYTSTEPGKNWAAPAFDADDWKKGQTGFGSVRTKNSTTRTVRTLWMEPRIWVRKSFEHTDDTGNLMLRIHHDGATKIFLNGSVIYEHEGSRYATWNFDKKSSSLLRPGKNVLAIQSSKGRRGNFLDVCLFDMKDERGDDILFSPGQPNLVRGPNGVEWWLVYMANKNSDRRGQFINRVHFFDRKLFADAITGRNTSGYHPKPSLPTFSDLFDEDRWSHSWDASDPAWRVESGEVRRGVDRPAHALIRSLPAEHYVFEAGVKLGPTSKRAGVYAWWSDDDHWMQVVLDREEKAWLCKLRMGKEVRTSSFPLSVDFDYDVFHALRIEKNSSRFSIRIDERPAPGRGVIEVKEAIGKGIPGLSAEGRGTTFDGVLYTIGWDEFDTGITGWMPSGKERTVLEDAGQTSETGLDLSEVRGENSVFKGDMLEAYEISLQVSAKSDGGSAGLYPVYIDSANYVKTVFDFRSLRLKISGKKNGTDIRSFAVPLATTSTLFADMRYTDFIEKHFYFDAPTTIDALCFSKVPHHQTDTLIDRIFSRVNLFYKQAEKWFPLSEFKEIPSQHHGYDKIGFEPLEAEALKIVNKDPEDHGFYIYKILADEVFRKSYNLRVVRHSDHLVFIVDGRELMRLKESFPGSRVGLVTENTAASFNGITLFALGTGARP